MKAFDKTPCTLAQLPNTAERYYRESLAPGAIDRQEIGKDACGRRVFQKYLDGEALGSPMALLTYAEFKAEVQKWSKLSPLMGVRRWVTAVMP